MGQSIQWRRISNICLKSKFNLAIMFTVEVGLTFIAQVHTQFVSNKSNTVMQTSIVFGT